MLFSKSRGDEESRSGSKTSQLLPQRKFLDEDGNFRINKYKLSFTADMVYGNAGFSSFYGVMGTAQMTFSDMLGNHRIIVATNLIGDLKNSDYAFAYMYLPDRIDWGIQGFHSARFLYGPSRTYYEDLYRYRQYGVGLTASYALDKFNRLEMIATLLTISQENLDDPLFGTSENTMVLPNIGYVHDNTLWGTWAPMRGTRYEMRATGSPGLGSTSLQFISLSFDYRKYFKFWDDYTFVFRGAGGGSFGKNAQRYFIGGTENWINPTYETGRIPINSAEDFAFLTAVLPLRGFNYNARIAQRFMLANAELRFPLVKYFLGGFLPYLLQSINGAMFVDIGAAMDSFDSFKGYKRDRFGNLTYNDLLIGTGFGARLWFLGFPFRFDVAWPYLGAGFGSPRYYISLGADF
jgi:outer membrane protein assembly factor BamA